VLYLAQFFTRAMLMAPKQQKPEKSILKNPGRSIKYRETSSRVSFEEKSHSKQTEALLLTFDNNDNQYSIKNSHSSLAEENGENNNSGKSPSDAPIEHEDLKDKNKEFELINLEAHTIVQTEILKLIDKKIHDFANSIFPNDTKGYEFSKHIIRNTWYNKQYTNIKQSCNLATQEEIREQRMQQLREINNYAEKWLDKVSIKRIAEYLRNKIKKAYPTDKFASAFFERYLFSALENAKKLNNYTSTNEVLDCVFLYLAKKDTLQITLLHHQFSQNLVLLRKHDLTTVTKMVFEQYLLKNMEIFFTASIHTYNFDSEFSRKLTELQTKFAEVMSILPIRYISPWRLLHLLATQGDRLFAASSTREITDIFLAHHALLNYDQELKIYNDFLEEIKDKIPHFFLKKVNGQTRFKDRDDLESDLSKLYWFNQRKEIQQTLAFFSQKNGPQLFPAQQRQHFDSYDDPESGLPLMPKV
jgi:hypothetical protein